jgi:hypothetical protein
MMGPVAGATSTGNLTKSPTDSNSANWSDGQTPVNGTSRSPSDTFTFSDAASYDEAVGPTVIDSFSDSISLTEATTPWLGIQESFTDAISPSDGTGLLQLLYTQENTDSFSLSDAIAYFEATAQSVTLSDSFSFTDDLAFAKGLGFTASDSISVTDVLDRNLGLLPSFTDTVSLSDTESKALGFGLSPADNFNIVDASGQTISDIQPSEDTFAFWTDDTTLVIGQRTIVADAFNFTDAITADILGGGGDTEELADSVGWADQVNFSGNGIGAAGTGGYLLQLQHLNILSGI